MSNKNINPNEFLRYPMDGITVLSLFLAVAPPIQLLVLVYFDHVWVGGRQLLVEIIDVFQNSFMPRFMLSYSFFMLQSALAGFWCAFGVAKGYGLTLTKAIIALIFFGFGVEIIMQSILFWWQHIAFNVISFLIALVQAILAGFVCWFITNKFKWSLSESDR